MHKRHPESKIVFINSLYKTAAWGCSASGLKKKISGSCHKFRRGREQGVQTLPLKQHTVI